MNYYTIATFGPELGDSSFVVLYYSCYSAENPSDTTNESLWIVPGTLEY